MKLIGLIGLMGAAAMVAGCHPAKVGYGRNRNDRPVQVLQRLICPKTQRELRLSGIASDGRRCTYTSDRGGGVDLELINVGASDSSSILDTMEQNLRARLPSAPSDGRATAVAPSQAIADRDDGTDHDDDDESQPHGVRATGHATITLPGLNIEASEHGAHIRALGHTIDASDSGAVIQGAWSGVSHDIHATDGGASIRSGFVGRDAIDMTFILTADQAGPSGDRMVGYVARGPRTGPLVVARVTSPVREHHDEGSELTDAKALVGRNLVP